MKSKPADNGRLTRREFVATTGFIAAGLALDASEADADALPVGEAVIGAARRRYALVGVGSRSAMYSEAVLKTFAEHAEMVAYCDNNEGRLRLARDRAQQVSGAAIPTFRADQFDRMMRETRPDTVIVTTKDSTHSQYIVRAMELGADVISEKPMTTDEKKCGEIIKAQRATGRKCTVTFNYRYSPARTQVKDMLMSGVIGDVLSVDFHWLLDTRHGADYFRRWHSRKADSGGLMVHKATHHFDLVNWWLSAVPVSVIGTGKREFYTPQMARRLGLRSHHERCHTCPERDKCTFFLDLAASPRLKALYLDQERYDGYFRDRCVWRPDIDIEDTMNVQVTYDNGVTMSYSLNAFNAWEGYVIAFNGTKGRLEHGIDERLPHGNPSNLPSIERVDESFIRIVPLRAPAYDVNVWEGTGDHAGGDAVMLNDLFLPQKPADKYMRQSDHRGGAYSILTGIAANRSFLTGKAVRIADLVPNIPLPDYPSMPSHSEPVPMPPRT